MVVGQFADAKLYTEFLAAHVLRSPLFLVIGHAEWMLALICIAIWLWWPALLFAIWISLRLAREIGNDTWEEFALPLNPGSPPCPQTPNP